MRESSFLSIKLTFLHYQSSGALAPPPESSSQDARSTIPAMAAPAVCQHDKSLHENLNQNRLQPSCTMRQGIRSNKQPPSSSRPPPPPHAAFNPTTLATPSPARTGKVSQRARQAATSPGRRQVGRAWSGAVFLRVTQRHQVVVSVSVHHSANQVHCIVCALLSLLCSVMAAKAITGDRSTPRGHTEG